MSCDQWMVREKEQDWEISDKEIGGRDMWKDISEWAKSIKIFVFIVNAHQRF